MEKYKIELTQEELNLLSEVFHTYKDEYRGCWDEVRNAMKVEKTLTFQTIGAYVSDTTYDIDLHRFDFIKNGAKVKWLDPAINDYPEEEREEQLNLVWEVFAQGSPVESENEIINIVNEFGGEAEVFAHELREI